MRRWSRHATTVSSRVSGPNRQQQQQQHPYRPSHPHDLPRPLPRAPQGQNLAAGDLDRR
jgi:hypothetical protein